MQRKKGFSLRIKDRENTIKSKLVKNGPKIMSNFNTFGTFKTCRSVINLNQLYVDVLIPFHF